jgi:hypothetical protein
LILVFYTAVFTHVPFFQQSIAESAAIEFGSAAVGNGLDHIT